jgi:hypothetical protein
VFAVDGNASSPELSDRPGGLDVTPSCPGLAATFACGSVPSLKRANVTIGKAVIATNRHKNAA